MSDAIISDSTRFTYSLEQRPLSASTRSTQLLLSFKDLPLSAPQEAQAQEAQAQEAQAQEAQDSSNTAPSHSLSKARCDQWLIATSGPLSERSAQQLAEAWREANQDHLERTLTVAGRKQEGSLEARLMSACEPMSAQLKRTAQERFEFEEADTTMEFDLSALEETPTPTHVSDERPTSPPETGREHLLICVARGYKATIPPDRDVSHYLSVTLYFEYVSPLIAAWLPWAARFGARVLFEHPTLTTELAALISASAHRERALVTLRPSPEGRLLSVVSLSSPLAALPIDGVTSFRPPLLKPHERAAWLVSFEPDPVRSAQGAMIYERALLRCDVGAEQRLLSEVSAELEAPLSLERLHPAVAFASQLAQYTRTLDQVLTCYARQELRKVVQGLDQLMKLSLALEGEARARQVHQLKVKFLHLGRLQHEDLMMLLWRLLDPPYQLTHEGAWCYSHEHFRRS